MQYVPIFVFAAFAVFAPGAYASGDSSSPLYNGVRINPNNILPREIHHYIVNKLPSKDQANYLPTSFQAKLVVEATRNPEFHTKLLKFIKRLDMHMPDETIASLFAEMIPSGRVPLGSFVRIVGPTALQANPESAKELVRLALSSVQNPKSLVTHEAKVSPRILLELARVTGPCDEIKRIFDLNAEQFKAGLGIDETWTDEFLDWFMSVYLPGIHPAIRISRDDLSKMQCFNIYSKFDPQMLADGFQWTVKDVDSILSGMNTPAYLIWLRIYQNHQTLLQVLPPLKPGPLVASSGKFDIRNGRKACFEQPPNEFDILDSLESQFGVKFTDDPASVSRITYNLLRSILVAGMDEKAMRSLLLSSWKVLLDSDQECPLKWAFKTICNGFPSGCSGSPYYQPHGVLGWVTQSQLLNELFKQKSYKVARTLLKLLKKYSLLPAHGMKTFYSDFIELLSKTKDGEELDEHGRKARDVILGGHPPQ